MSTQTQIDFDAPAQARRTDPATSHEAARQVEASGVASHQRERCLAEVRRLSGQTAAEIADRTGLERHVPSRRLPELRRQGLVRNGAARTCNVCSTRQMTWIAV